MHRHRFTQGRVITGIATSALLLTGLAGVPSVSAADEPAPNGAVLTGGTSNVTETRTAPAKRKPIPQGQCARNGGVLGLASVAGQRLVGGKVSVLTRPSKGGWFTKAQRLKGAAKTNAAGGFYVAARCLPEYFVVSVTGGTVNGVPFTGTLTSLARASEPAVIVTPVTTVAVEYSRSHRGAPPVKVARLVKKHFDLVDYGPRLVDLGMGSRVISSAFDPAAFMKAAERDGGLAVFARKSAGRIGSGKVRSFAPANYVPKQRPGYGPAPDGPSDGVTVTQAGAVRPRGGVSSALSSIAGKAMVGETCKLLGPSIASDLAGVCPTDYSSALDAINQSLIAISKQLDELQESVDEIIDMLTVMEQQIADLQASVNKIIQQNIKSEAQAAQQAYATAYNYSSATEVSSLVEQAVFDIVILGSLPLTQEDTWTTVAPSATVESKCLTVYSKYNITSGEYAGQNPLSLCKDYQYRTSGLFDNNTYNMKLYRALTGASGTPQGNLLVYQQQQALTSGANAPIKQEILKQSFDQMGQLGQLMDIGYAMYGAWQTFEYAITTGDLAACPNLTVSGTFPANTTITTSSACNTLQSGLFTASVQNQIAGKIALPPAGSVSDPRNNYVWWGYPLDVAGGTYQSTSELPSKPMPPSTFPWYPTDDGSYPYNPAFGDAKSLPWYGLMLPSLRGALYNAFGGAYGPPQPLLKGATAADFGMPTVNEMLTLFADLPLNSGQTYAGALGAVGFRGIGQNKYGMNWTNLAAGLSWRGVQSKTDPNTLATIPNQIWGTTNSAAPNTIQCPGWPNTGFDWVVLYTPQLAMCSLTAPMADKAWNLASSTAPTTSNQVTCPSGILSEFVWGKGYTLPALCLKDTFALLLNNQYRSPSASSGGWTPPFYQPAMLTGPSSSGVPALPLS
jgi:hypothetical protein